MIVKVQNMCLLLISGRTQSQNAKSKCHIDFRVPTQVGGHMAMTSNLTMLHGITVLLLIGLKDFV